MIAMLSLGRLLMVVWIAYGLVLIFAPAGSRPRCGL
jgi:hypothetical protein